jgi:hypothetical protein
MKHRYKKLGQQAIYRNKNYAISHTKERAIMQRKVVIANMMLVQGTNRIKQASLSLISNM